MEFLIELFGEFLFQLVWELVGALIEGAWGGSIRVGRLFRAVCYLLLGAALGAVSVVFVPHPVVMQTPNALVSLLLVPLAVGSVTVLLCRFIEERSEWSLLASRFVYSFLFAFMFAGTRFSLL